MTSWGGEKRGKTMNDIDNDPTNVEYWELAKVFVEQFPQMAEGYAEVAGITNDEFNVSTPSELCNKYNRTFNRIRQHMLGAV